ncbi:MAG: outer membrane protein assembly factor BamB family protein [Actinomycetota bacterium]
MRTHRFAIILFSLGILISGCTSSGPKAHSAKSALASASGSPHPSASTSAPPVPFDGELLIADRGNNRLLLVNASKTVVWQYPSPGMPPPPGGFYFPDDAFFTRHGHGIISNQEQNETVVEISFPQGKLLWQYGHPHVAGAANGYLHEPDDAYVLPDHRIVIADAQNCRIVVLNQKHTFDHQIGTTGGCAHQPPKYLGSPNGDTPLSDGNILVSEILGHSIDEITLSGKLIWSVRLPIRYVSDPQQLGPNDYLVSDYSRPGGIYEFNRSGQILWSYHPRSGDAELDHPSLSERLPNGFIACNDDSRHRVVVIDPATKKIVWQYGITDHSGTARGYLNTPDGFDLLAPDGSYPTHSITG